MKGSVKILSMIVLLVDHNFVWTVPNLGVGTGEFMSFAEQIASLPIFTRFSNSQLTLNIHVLQNPSNPDKKQKSAKKKTGEKIITDYYSWF